MTMSLLSKAVVCSVALYGRRVGGQIENITFLGGDDTTGTTQRAPTATSSSSSILSFFSSNPFTDIVSSAGIPFTSDDTSSSSSSSSSSSPLVCQSLGLLGLNTSNGKPITTCNDLLSFSSLQKVLPTAVDDTCRWRELPSPTTQKGMDECVFITTAQLNAARKESPKKADDTSSSLSSFFPSFFSDIIGGGASSSNNRKAFDPTLPLCCRAAVEGNDKQETTTDDDGDDDDATMPSPTRNPPPRPISPPVPIDEGPQCAIDCLLYDDGGCRACLCDQGAARECITYGSPSATCKETEWNGPKLSKKEHSDLLHKAEVEMVKSLHTAFSKGIHNKEQEPRNIFSLFNSVGSPRCLVPAPSTPPPPPTPTPELPINPICTTGCSNFFDGCNTCQCHPTNPNGPARCTRKACPPEAIFDTPFCVDDNGTVTTTSFPPEDCGSLVCTAQYDPVCGTDGNTYSNACQLGIAQCNNPDTPIAVASEGLCPDDDVVEEMDNDGED